MEEGWPLLVIEDGADIVERLHEKEIEVISGNAAEDPVLAAANLAKARVLIVAIPNGFEAGQIVEQARGANPSLDIIARAHFDAEVDHLLAHGANTVIMGEREIARTILEHTKALAPPATEVGPLEETPDEEAHPSVAESPPATDDGQASLETEPASIEEESSPVETEPPSSREEEPSLEPGTPKVP